MSEIGVVLNETLAWLQFEIKIEPLALICHCY